MISKPELRQQIRSTLLEQSQDGLREALAIIRKRVLELPAWQEAGVVGFFAAQLLEPLIDSLLDEALAAGKRAVYPRVTPQGLALVEVFSHADLQETPRWKLREPAAEHLHKIAPGEVELLLVPGLAFDRAGHRLGRGGGFYDRLLADVQPVASASLPMIVTLTQKSQGARTSRPPPMPLRHWSKTKASRSRPAMNL